MNGLNLPTSQFVDSLDKEYERLLKASKKKGGALMAVQRFNEYLVRLDRRYEELEHVQMEISTAAPSKMKDPLAFIQMDFMDRLEIFYQGLYSTLSAFAMLINNIAPHSEKRDLPIGSVQKFIEYLQERFPKLKKELELLEKARAFRAKFVDHIQQHTLHDWMTYSPAVGEAVVIYFIPSNNSYPDYGDFTDPFNPTFKPPVGHKSFYVSPPFKKVFKSLKKVVKDTLSATNKS